MHTELDHRFDHQHDLEPVHFREHAVLKAIIPVKDDQKSMFPEEILDETPYERENRRSHDDDAHFWTTEHEDTSLYRKLREHYEKEFHHEDGDHEHEVDHEHGFWTGISHDAPRHEMMEPMHHEHHEDQHHIYESPHHEMIEPMHHEQHHEQYPSYEDLVHQAHHEESHAQYAVDPVHFEPIHLTNEHLDRHQAEHFESLS